MTEENQCHRITVSDELPPVVGLSVNNTARSQQWLMREPMCVVFVLLFLGFATPVARSL